MYMTMGNYLDSRFYWAFSFFKPSRERGGGGRVRILYGLC